MSSSPITVRVNPSVKLSQCVDNESSRYALAGVMIEPIIGMEPVNVGIDTDGKSTTEMQPINRVYVAATDSRVLAITIQEGIAVDTAIMPGSLATPPKKTSKAKTVTLNGEWRADETHRKTRVVTSTVAGMVEGGFPRYHDILPATPAVKTVSIRLDAIMLAKLAEAFATDDERGIDLIFQTVTDENGQTYIDEDAGPICVAGANGFGAIMPISRDSELGGKPQDHHQASLERWNGWHDGLKDNRLMENTDERRAAVLAILNPVTETTPA